MAEVELHQAVQVLATDLQADGRHGPAEAGLEHTIAFFLYERSVLVLAQRIEVCTQTYAAIQTYVLAVEVGKVQLGQHDNLVAAFALGDRLLDLVDMPSAVEGACAEAQPFGGVEAVVDAVRAVDVRLGVIVLAALEQQREETLCSGKERGRTDGDGQAVAVVSPVVALRHSGGSETHQEGQGKDCFFHSAKCRVHSA